MESKHNILAMVEKAKKRATHSLHDTTSHSLHGNSIPQIGYYYFWPGLIVIPKNTQPIHSPTSTHKQNIFFIQ
jgi:hypothetical protein